MSPSQALVAHDCNPSYSGGREREDQGWKPASQIVHRTLSQKYLTQKRMVECRPQVQAPVPQTNKQKSLYIWKESD
jgi:hypothetical protein